ncbi:MAG TPA: WbqC family protein [Puia sp.]|nr:WbqC family protein [Puia sp.]
MNIVISQPMYFPWVGMFEQVRLSNVFVFYDDVQFSKGSFTNRVQVKTGTGEGFKWLTIPLEGLKLGALINEIEICNKKNWKNEHLDLLKSCYQKAPFYADMMEIVGELFDYATNNLSLFTIKSMELVLKYYELDKHVLISKSSDLNIPGKSYQRVLDIVKHFGGDTYITGHGAKNYLDAALFEENNVQVEFMDYQRIPYSQLFGAFNPHVSILDLVANEGRSGINRIISSTINHKFFLQKQV